MRKILTRVDENIRGETLAAGVALQRNKRTTLSIAAHSAVGLVFLLLAGRLLRLTYRYAVNIFFWDQWVFHDADLFQKHSWWQMFRWQFGPHRLGLGPWVSTLLEPYFHWNSRAVSFLACGIVVVAAACALWLKQRLYGNVSISDVAVPVIYLSAGQYELIFINSNLAQPLPLLLITVDCLCWTIQNLWSRWLLVLLINFITTYTGYGLFLGFLTPPLLVIDYFMNFRKHRGASLYFAASLGFACASLASFVYDYRLQPGVNCFSLTFQSPLQYLWYVSLMFANFFGVKGSGPFPRLFGSLVILWLVSTLAFAIRKMFSPLRSLWAINAISVTLLAFSLLFAMNTALGRLCLGLESAQASRYITFLALGVFGAYLHLLSWPASKLRNGLLTAIVIALLATVPIRAQDRGLMRYFSEIKKNWRECYLKGGTIASCDQAAGYKIDPEPESVLRRKLDFLKRSRQNLYSTR